MAGSGAPLEWRARNRRRLRRFEYCAALICRLCLLFGVFPGVGDSSGLATGVPVPPFLVLRPKEGGAKEEEVEKPSCVDLLDRRDRSCEVENWELRAPVVIIQAGELVFA